MDAFQYRLQNTVRTVIRLHGIGKDKFTARFQHPIHFIKHTLTMP